MIDPRPPGPEIVEQYQADTDWRQHAVCRGSDPALFFPERGADVKPAKAVCATCPVAADCLEYALGCTDRLAGIWGGTAESERRRMRRQRNGTAYGTTGARSTQALANRQRVLDALNGTPVSVPALAERLKLNEQTIRNHAQALAEDGMAEITRAGIRRAS